MSLDTADEKVLQREELVKVSKTVSAECRAGASVPVSVF